MSNLAELGVNHDMSWTCKHCDKLIPPFRGGAQGHSCRMLPRDYEKHPIAGYSKFPAASPDSEQIYY